MRRQTTPRRRPMRDRRRKPTPGVFTVSGVPLDSLYPRRYSVTWNRGDLSGDPGIIAAAHERAAALEGQHVGPVEGPVTNRDHLRSALSAVFVLLDLFIPGTVDVSGDVPERPPIPKGAIG